MDPINFYFENSEYRVNGTLMKDEIVKFKSH